MQPQSKSINGRIYESTSDRTNETHKATCRPNPQGYIGKSNLLERLNGPHNPKCNFTSYGYTVKLNKQPQPESLNKAKEPSNQAQTGITKQTSSQQSDILNIERKETHKLTYRPNLDGNNSIINLYECLKGPHNLTCNFTSHGHTGKLNIQPQLESLNKTKNPTCNLASYNITDNITLK